MLTVSGALSLQKSINYLLTGDSGSGKSTILSAISLIVGVTVPPVDEINRQKIVVGGLQGNIRVGFLHQNPIDNFYGGPLFDAIRISVSASDLPVDEIVKELGSILTTIFAIDPNFLNRDPNFLSSGQQQLVAAALQLIMRPQVLLMDEPFARLSHGNAQRLLQLMNDRCTNTYCLVATHVQGQYGEDDGSGMPTTQSFEVSRYENDVSIQMKVDPRNNVAATMNFDEFKDSVEPLINDFVDPVSLKSSWTESHGFVDLPEKGPKCIFGKDNSLSGKLSVFSVSQREKTLCYGDITIAGGLNVLYGDNGAGKTLVCRILAGEIPRSNFFRKKLFGSNLLYSAQKSRLRMGDREDSFSKIASKGMSFFQPVDPGLRVGGLSIEKTIAIFDSDTKTKALSLLGGYNSTPSMRVDDLPFGLQKMLSFFFMPEELAVAILDEPFANLPDCLQLAVADEILRRIYTKKWRSVVVTSNRPIDTLLLFAQAASGMS